MPKTQALFPSPKLARKGARAADESFRRAWQRADASLLRLIACAVCGLLMLLVGSSTWAQESKVFSPQGSGRQDLRPYMEVAQDPSGKLTIDDVAEGRLTTFRPARSVEWTGVKRDVYWLKINVDLRRYNETNSYLLLEPQPVGRFDLFYPDFAGGFGVSTIAAGQIVGERNLSIRALVLRLPTPSGPATIYLRLEQRSQPLLLQVSWISNLAAIEEVATEQMIQGVLFGALIVLVLHNVFVLSKTGELVHLYYAMYLSFFMTLFCLLTGIWTRVGPIQSSGPLITCINAGVVACGLAVMRGLFDLDVHAPRINRAGWFVVWGAVAAGLLAVTGWDATEKIGYMSSAMLVPAALTVIMAGSLVRLRQGYEPAKYSSIGIAVQMVASTIYILQFLQLLPGAFSVLWVESAVIWEALLFSFALAHRLRVAEDASKKQLQEAQAATKDKNLFFSLISHELRTPIGVIVAELEAEDQRTGGQERRASTKNIRWAVRSMESQIQDLFVLSMGDEHHLEMRPQPFDVRELIEEVIASMESSATARGVTMTMHGPEMLIVVSDPRRVEQVLLNLVENAVKYTKGGDVSIEYEMGENKELRMSVKDTGTGIAPEHKDKLFQPYRRFGAIDKDRNSFGIGLAVVQTLLRHLGGRVTVESTLGKGSNFTVYIPIEEEQIIERRHGDEIAMLIVDDRQEMLDGLEKTAQTLGYQVDISLSAAAAANLMAVNVYDIVLIDLDMPGKNGYELASETRRGDGANAGTRLVAISAGTPQASGLDFSINLWPFDAFLQKPIHGKDIRSVVETRTPDSKGY